MKSSSSFAARKPALRCLSTAVITVVLSLVALTMLAPLAYMALTSLRTMREYMRSPIGWPVVPSFENYLSLYMGYPVLSGLRNSFLVALISLAASLAVAIPAAFSFAKSKVRWLRPLYLFILSLMMVPVMVTILPRYILFSKIGLIDTLFVLILSYVGSTLPYTTYLLTAGFKGIPTELLEAARIDGSGWFRVVWSIVVPLGRPSIIAVCILDFVAFWNELLQALMYINTQELKPITSLVSTLGGRFVSNMPLMMAGLCLATIPVVLAYMLFERYIVAGITMGSSK